LAILLLFNLLLVTIFSDYGLVDLASMRRDRDLLIEKNDALVKENLAMSREIDRLKNDLDYIESIARRELGMIKKDEIILKIEGGGNRETSK
jgi:cell division protein FtsB